MPRSFVFFCLLPLAVVGCGSSERAAPSLVLSGSKSMLPLLTDIRERFEQDHPRARLHIEVTTSDKGIADTRTGLADVGLVARRLHPDEMSLHAVEIARDGVAVVLHRDNPVKSLDDEQIVGLFTRRYSNWKEVGGTDRLVTPLGVSEGRSLRRVFLDHFALSPNRVKTDPGISSSEQVLAGVANRPNAIGYVCLGRAELASTKQPIRLLPLGNVPATLANLRAGRYPLTRPLLLVTRDTPTGLVKQFLDFARSDEAADLLEKHGFAPAQNQDSTR